MYKLFDYAKVGTVHTGYTNILKYIRKIYSGGAVIKSVSSPRIVIFFWCRFVSLCNINKTYVFFEKRRSRYSLDM